MIDASLTALSPQHHCRSFVRSTLFRWAARAIQTYYTRIVTILYQSCPLGQSFPFLPGIQGGLFILFILFIIYLFIFNEYQNVFKIVRNYFSHFFSLFLFLGPNILAILSLDPSPSMLNDDVSTMSIDPYEQITSMLENKMVKKYDKKINYHIYQQNTRSFPIISLYFFFLGISWQLVSYLKVMNINENTPL